MPTGPGSGRIFAIATAEAEKLGYHDFSPGSAGARKRSQLAEAIARQHPHAKGLGRRKKKGGY